MHTGHEPTCKTRTEAEICVFEGNSFVLSQFTFVNLRQVLACAQCKLTLQLFQGTSDRMELRCLPAKDNPYRRSG